MVYACESRPSGVHGGDPSVMLSLKQECEIPEPDEWVLIKTLPGDPISRKWERVVEVFTTCSLTREEDKLTALAGVAQKFLESVPPNKKPIKYLAGLWSGEYLIRNLPWCRRGWNTAPENFVHFRPEAF
jgi:hypothetical protein